MTRPGETAPGMPNGTRYLCPLCDWWLDVAPPDLHAPLSRPVSGRTIDDVVRQQMLDHDAAIEGALAGHFATTQHRPQAANRYAPWDTESLAACRCGHLRGDHYRDHSCLHSTETETWACDCAEFVAR